MLFVIPNIIFGQHNYESHFEHCNKAEHAEHYQDLLKDASREDDANIDLVHYEFRWYVDPAVYQLSGSAAVTFKPEVEDLTQFMLELGKDMQIDSIISEGGSKAFTRVGDFQVNIFNENGMKKTNSTPSLFIITVNLHPVAWDHLSKTTTVGFLLSGPFQSHLEPGTGGHVKMA